MAQLATNDDELITGINVTPLVDIVLVLLIVLMVTASYTISKSIPVDLPKGSTGQSVSGTLALSVTRDGRLFADGAPITELELRARARRGRGTARAVIAADGAAAHRSVVRVIDLLRQEGLHRFALDVRPEAEP
jgi:biopolymer transport protein ExbD